MHRGASSATPVLELIFIFVIGLNDELEPVHALAYCIYYAVIKLKQWITCLTNFFSFFRFHSHQIFHVLVIAAAFVHYRGISNMAVHRLTKVESYLKEDNENYLVPYGTFQLRCAVCGKQNIRVNKFVRSTKADLFPSPSPVWLL